MLKTTITLALTLRICSISLWAQEYDQSISLESSNKRSLILKIASIVEKEHFDAIIGKRIHTMLTNNETTGKYRGIHDEIDLITQINKDIGQISSDQHLQLTASTQVLSEKTTRKEQAIDSNYGINKVELLDHNIALIKITAFYRPEEAWNKIKAALYLVRDADAIILDLRNNGGGSPQTMKKLINQFIGIAGIPLYKFIERDFIGANIVTDIPEAELNFKGIPLYVLVSKKTFSAAEGFVFFLKEHRKMIVIGEKTFGSSNRAFTYKINDKIELTVPNASIKSIKTGLNWEGTGIVPDVLKSSEEALPAAYDLALADKIRIQGKTLN